MQELIKKSYNGVPIEFELINGRLMANATAMCNVFSKRAQHFLDLGSTQRYIKALEAKPEFPALVETRQGGANPGTWIHERLILKLAQWLDVDFEVWCDEQIAELLRTGKVELRKLSPAELILAQAQQLVDHERRMHEVETKQQVLEVAQADTHREVQHLSKQVAEVAAKQTTSDITHYTVAGYAKLVRRQLSLSEAMELGKQAKAMSQQLNLSTGKAKDQRFGQVGTYHQDVLRLVFGAELPRTGRLAA